MVIPVPAVGRDNGEPTDFAKKARPIMIILIILQFSLGCCRLYILDIFGGVWTIVLAFCGVWAYASGRGPYMGDLMFWGLVTFFCMWIFDLIMFLERVFKNNKPLFSGGTEETSSFRNNFASSTLIAALLIDITIPIFAIILYKERYSNIESHPILPDRSHDSISTGVTRSSGSSDHSGQHTSGASFTAFQDISQSPWFSITSEDAIYAAPIDHVLFGGHEHLVAHTNAEYAHKGLTQRDRLDSLTKTYAAMVRAFEKAGLDVFLESSCLIGFIRHNGNPIPWDMDIDIGFLEDECLNVFPNGNDDMYSKVSELLGPEYSVDKMGCDCGVDCEGDDGRMVGHVADKDTGFGVDIFSYARVTPDKLRPWQHDGRQWFERIRDRDDYTFPEEALLPLQNTTFAGVNGVLIPHNPRLFSSYEYGTNLEIHPFPWGFLAYSNLGPLGYCLAIIYLLIEFPDSWDDKRVPYWFYTALCLALFRGGLQSSVVGTCAINKYVPKPYMDEIFHIPQTQVYCDGHNFAEWDDHITTLPGLYFWAMATLGLIHAPCTVNNLRLFVSIVPTAIISIIVGLFIWSLGPPSHRILRTLTVLLYPTSFFYNNLYYTDTASTALVLATLYLHAHRRYILAGVVGAISVFCRQTNIVWLFGMALYHCLVEGLLPCIRTRKVDIHHLLTVVASLWTYILTGVGFIAFVVYNGSIVVGHKENHVASWHWAQIPYLILTVTFFMGPIVWLSIARYAIRAPKPLTDAFIIAICSIMLQFGTIAHPFLLADNRHFTFYLWRHVLTHRVVRLGIIPFAVAIIIRGTLNSPVGKRLFHKTDNRVAVWVFGLCCFLALVPSPLLELRYFNIPAMAVLLVYACCEDGLWMLYSTVGWMATINFISLLIFTERPFLSAATGELERFMW
ncbi:glucosyltransferase [Perkinsus chesapeaki]|uniref:Dol-P-Glc:Glc(2)Man(9)GlcNAc(2)-PP-Dol alpha-1,2-glucosyltransferase n=1 Tax=Perkinsus chesapeaki TaxID=330153 RepID=A0A7J6LV83_PERCH|nr:glucosyltransferase [Perkinsus chesapeaki]